MIYVASPYSVIPPEWIQAGMSQESLAKKMPELLEYRYRSVMHYVANRMERAEDGESYFSPILYTHNIARIYSLPKTFEWWAEMNHRYLDVCSEVHVLKMDCWEDSLGVRGEIDYAVKKGISIKYIDWEG